MKENQGFLYHQWNHVYYLENTKHFYRLNVWIPHISMIVVNYAVGFVPHL
jgi:hypothetical protein